MNEAISSRGRGRSNGPVPYAFSSAPPLAGDDPGYVFQAEIPSPILGPSDPRNLPSAPPLAGNPQYMFQASISPNNPAGLSSAPPLAGHDPQYMYQGFTPPPFLNGNPAGLSAAPPLAGRDPSYMYQGFTPPPFLNGNPAGQAMLAAPGGYYEALLAQNGVSCSQWLSWTAPQRTRVLSVIVPKYAGESDASFFVRLGAMMPFVTTDCFRARIIQSGVAGVRPAGQTTTSTDAMGRTTTNTTTTGQAALATAGAAIGVTAQAITAALAANDQVQIAQIQAETTRYIASLQHQSGQAVDSTTAAAQQQQLLALQALQAQLNAAQAANASSSSNKTMLYIALAVGAIVIIGAGAYMFMRRGPRNNPVLFKHGKPERFVPAAELRRKGRKGGRRRRSRRLAA